MASTPATPCGRTAQAAIATINELTDYAEGVRRTTTERFEALGGTVSAAEAYTSDATDFRSQLTKLTETNPDAIHVAAQSEFTGGTIVKQLRELGYDGPIYGESVVAGTQALEIAGAAADGLKAIIPSPDLETERGSSSSPTSASATASSPCPGSWAPHTTTSSSQRSALR